MNLFDITEEKETKKTVRILVYPNITFQKDLEKDSYIQVIKNQIRLLNEIRDDLWFYLILTKPMPELAFHNVTQYYIDLPTYPPTMRSHFDVPEIKSIINADLDFDLVMSHLPEHTHQLKNVMHNVTHHTPLFFGYSHWFDLDNVVAWPKDSFLQNITGLLEYDRCYLNTEHQKQLVLDQASDTFNDETIGKLNDILTVQHLGVSSQDIVDDINSNPDKIIVFNHRPDTYKHFKQFMKTMDKLREIRDDFKVWVPLLDTSDRDWVITDKGDKTWYYNKLKECYVGFSPKQTYGGWSVATTDGMMNGVPYIMYDDTYYHELWDTGDFFDDDEDALRLLNTYLDNPDYRNEMAESALDWMRTQLIYKDKMQEMSEYIDSLVSKTKTMSDTEVMKGLVDFVKENRQVTKREINAKLGWGRGIKWTPYRRALMNHPNIYDTLSEIPTYTWVD